MADHARAEKTHVTKGQVALFLALSLFALFCLLPVLLVLIVSLSSEASINANGFSFFPTEWSTSAYQYVATFSGQLLQSYKVTLFTSVVGTLLTLVLTSMFAYSLSRKDFMLRNALAIYLLITMLFNGGMLGSFLVNSNVYRLRNNLMVLVLPGAVTTMNTIVMRTFIQSNVSDSLVDAAKIDGASEYYLFFRIVIPIMLPVLASIGFLSVVGHWNEWQTALLYIDDPDLATLQLMLMRVEKSLSYLQERMSYLSEYEMQLLKNSPTETSRMALLFCTLGPILVIYPFFQKYFIRGITIGAVKG